jgi:hypothetical protein
MKSFLVILILTVMNCKNKLQNPIIGEDYKMDQFNTNYIIEVNKTKEDEVLNTLKLNPTYVHNFSIPYIKKIGSHKFEVDKIYRYEFYKYVKTQEKIDDTVIEKSVMKESLIIRIFLKDGIVTFFFIVHKVRNISDGDQDFLIGKYNSIDLKLVEGNIFIDDMNFFWAIHENCDLEDYPPSCEESRKFYEDLKSGKDIKSSIELVK